jgi:hypothetical protein
MRGSETDIDLERASIKSDLASIAASIGFYHRDLDRLRNREKLLQFRLARLDKLEQTRNEAGLLELIRMCNTPVRFFQPMILNTMGSL